MYNRTGKKSIAAEASIEVITIEEVANNGSSPKSKRCKTV
jgi:hypothetical protein